MRVLVCGGRNFTDGGLLNVTLNHINNENEITTIIHGAANGADYLANVFAEVHDIPVKEYPANWKKYGRSAGPIRNKKMLEDGKPDMVVAFEGGSGTKHMMKTAHNAGVPTWYVTKYGMYPYNGV